MVKVTNPYLELGEKFYSFEKITPLNRPYLVDVNERFANELGLDFSQKEWEEILNGKRLLEGSKPFSMVYAGHQFGYFVPKLGDGRVVNIGKINSYHLQLKGSGVNSYSRSGDGRALFRSSVREYLASEAMFYLGVETTRGVALLGAEHQIYREEWQKAAIVLRASRSWVRFGTFEYFANSKELEALANYVIGESFSFLEGERDRYFLMFMEIVKRSARLVAKWNSIGFVHGVLNSDNCLVDGSTIDYGPFAFLEVYEDFTPNRGDKKRRYSFGRQALIMKYNLNMLAKSLGGLIESKDLVYALLLFDSIYVEEFFRLMKRKLGFLEEMEGDIELIVELLEILKKDKVDYSSFFYNLTYDKELFIEKRWIKKYKERMRMEDITKSKEIMRKTNPRYILRGYILEEAIERGLNGDFSLIKRLKEVVQSPYERDLEFEGLLKEKKWQNIRLSCSS
ncbi:MAG: YdiU family protein [Epsilonproteobacteria bacterium]|nr:YdiU family protein [Campylobacterota bacterium]